MDHIPRVTNPVHPPLQVPCLSYGPYQPSTETFEDYPTQRGWDIHLLKRGVFDQHSVEDTRAFLQDWLFFGLLHEVLGDDFIRESFLQWNPQRKRTMITTANLVPHLTTRFQQIRTNSVRSLDGKTQAIADLDRIDSALCTLSFFCNMAVADEGDDSISSPIQSQWPLSPAVDMSIRVLGPLVSSAVYLTGMFLKHSPTPSLTFPGGNLTRTRMRQAGWCPSDIAMVSEYMSAASLYYASSLRRSQLHPDHANCSRQLCLATQLDTRTYQTAHSAHGCRCEHVIVPVSKLIPIIAKRGIPLITIAIAKSGDPILNISPYRKGQHYIAFSHVWSDGLGNLHQNSLPRCQILRLKALVDELSWSKGIWDDLNKCHLAKYWNRLQGCTVPFWLDTLCIPVGSEHQTFRSMAISLMYKTYVSAQHVLVLDSELQRTPIPKDMTEVFLRISISGWMRRLWTLQESVLGRRLQVKFEDGIVDLVTEYNLGNKLTADDHRKHKAHLGGAVEKFERLAGSPHSDCRSFYWKDRTLRFLIVEKRERRFLGVITTFTPLVRIDPAQEKIGNECSAILEAFVSSNYRSSLRKADEHLCLSGLLGWDTNCLQGVATDQRMKTLLSKRTFLPQGLLFIAGPRMPEKGWRWALQSFGNNGSEQLRARLVLRDSTPAKLCALGLIVQYPGFIMPSSNQPTNLDDFFVEAPLFEQYPSVVCRIRRHLARPEEGISDVPASDRRESGTRPSVGLFFYSPVPIIAPNIPLGAIIVEMEEGSQELASPELDGALACSYLHLATLEMLGYRETAPPIWADILARTNVHVISRDDFGTKKWCVG
ncbi:MAG: hypothetical protein Q9215_005351 [Flavoplaca cf. flavocitrina]